MDNQNMLYMAYDGDNAGRLCGRAILADNPDALHEVSARINLGHEIVKKWVESHGGQFISGGGDEGVFSIPAEAIHSVEELRHDYEFATNLTSTIGVGKTLSEAGKAMLVGKFRGKNTVVQYDPSIEQEIKQAQDHLSQGTASQEEKKIGEAYLQPEGTGATMSQDLKNSEGAAPADAHGDCPYCKEMSSQNVEDPDHCKYCHDANEHDCPYCQQMDAKAPHDVNAEGHPDDCPYCAEMANHDPSAEGHPDDCPYCAEMDSHDPNAEGHPEDCPYCQKMNAKPSDGSGPQQTAGPTVKHPTTTDSEDYAGQDMNQPDIPKPDAIQSMPDGLGTSFDSPTNENVKLDAEGQGGTNETVTEEVASVDPQSEETVESIAQELEQEPPQALPASEVSQIDDADTAVGTSMEGNVSRPEGYDEQGHPQDMGLGEEEQGSPDITSVMQEGLDSHADNIQRERVIGLVSEALQGFKGCKGILEKAREQAPQLYESSIAMLKAMIEMAKMMGLDQEAQAPDSENPLGDEVPAVQSADGLPEYEQSEAATDQNNLSGESESMDSLPQYEQSEEKAVPEGKQKGQ